MKNKKILFLLTGVLIIILIILFFIIKNFRVDSKNPDLSDYTPEEEISASGLRETVVTLYFTDTTDGTLKSEGKPIDSATLLENPYQELVKLLLAGTQTKNFSTIFPANTQILNASLENNCAVLNFSGELLNYTDETQKYNIINGLLNTLTNLNEVNSIKILVNNELPDGFNEKYVINSKDLS